eukprot:SAG22_NODE_693_length_7872_cov_13.111797_2_plen_84_part_00
MRSAVVVDAMPGGLFGNQVDHSTLGQADYVLAGTTSASDHVYAVLHANNTPPMVMPLKSMGARVAMPSSSAVGPYSRLPDARP